ncbi:hypothetical protein PHJA_000429700 [Phtheirospermum japonicum]|uniref:S-protein homolog n=1 Tax=Phtheirospermum japonicum TaxID=374723 RepID=A0A830B786_9LAMI|nr:hypothetical protein PHJA_000429700 [Phtheirospermum japonicum]
MNYAVVIYVLLSCILSYSINSRASACIIPPYKFEVCVMNKLPPNTEPLLYHCASKDDDLGYRTLTTNKEFRFGFCLKPWRTLFFCRFNWGQKTKAFDVFNAKWVPKIPCKTHTCYWIAKSDGIYFTGTYPFEGVPITKKFDWE